MFGMDDSPRELVEFRARFGSEAGCLDYLVALRWPDGFRCPVCGHSDSRRTAQGLLECRRRRRQTSVTAGTLFHDTRKPLRLWFEAMWHVCSQKYGASALGLQRVLGLGSYHTAWRWLHRLRRAMLRPGHDRLTGTVEVDETYIDGKHPGKPGGGAEGKALVVVAVEDRGRPETGERGIGRIRLAHVTSLCGFVQEQVAHGSTIRTHGWIVYDGLPSRGYVHEVVPPSEMTIEHLAVSLLKRWLLGTYQGAVKEQHLRYYLDEFTFRFNRRKSGSRGKLFYRLVQQALQAEPVTGARIIGGDSPGDDAEADPLSSGSEDQEL